MKTETYLFSQLLYKIVILIALLFLCTVPIAMYAQDTTPASGGNATGTGGSVSYTIGQIVYTTNSGTNGSLSQGVQQPYEISLVTGIEEPSDISIQNISPSTYFLKVTDKNKVLKTFKIIKN
jgi:hypothetical protein